LTQFSLAAFTIAQFAVGYWLIAQFGLFIAEGHGQSVIPLVRLIGLG
jgi:hypothetical protein